MPARRIRSSSTTSCAASATGARLYVIDPRRTSSAEWADGWLGLDVGSDIALANAIAREIIARRSRGPRSSSSAPPWTSRPTGPRSSRTRSSTPSARRASRPRPSASWPTRSRRRRRAMICWTLGHHRAPQRGRQRPRAHLAGPADRARRALRQRRQPVAWPEQRPGRRRHGRPPRPPARLPARRERRAAGEVRRRVGRRRAAQARLAPVRDVRRDGARRPDRGLLHRREPGPVRGRPEAGDRACSRASTSSSSRTCS